MGKPGSKSLSRKGEQSEGPEHKAKTAAPKRVLLVFADLLTFQGKNECGGEFVLNLKTKEVKRIKGADVIDFSTPAMRALTCPERKPLE